MSTPQPLPAKTQRRYYFGCAEFDPQSLQLSVLGQTVALERRPLRLLGELLHQADHVVSREELLRTVWGGRVTVRNVLPNAMTKLRKALGRDGKLIVTVPGVGYRLNGPVRVVLGQSAADDLQSPNSSAPAPTSLDVLPLRSANSRNGDAGHMPEPGDLEPTTAHQRGAGRVTGFQAFASLPLARRIELFAPVAEMLRRRHANGLLYNAISQNDLTVFADGKVLLLPKRAHDADHEVHAPAHDPYRPPEIYRGLSGSQRSDIYALGVMFYQFVVGDLERPLLADWQDDVPDAGHRRTIHAATRPEPSLRPASVDDWLTMPDESEEVAVTSWQWMFGLPTKLSRRVRT